FLPVDERFMRGGTIANHLLRALFVLLLLTPAVFAGERRSLPARILRNRTLAWVGLISYAVYLWHLLVINVLTSKLHIFDHISGTTFIVLTIPTLIGSLALGAASYYLLERPVLRLKFRPPWRATPSPARQT